MLTDRSFTVSNTMTTEPKTLKEAAEALYTTTPRAISCAMLEEYGIEATAAQAEDITYELLSLNLYWAHVAIESYLPREFRTVMCEYLLELIRLDWSGQFKLSHAKWADYRQELEARRHTYAQVVEAGGSPLAVQTEAGALLEDRGAVREEDRSKFLALLIDLVPVEAYGELLKGLG